MGTGRAGAAGLEAGQGPVTDLIVYGKLSCCQITVNREVGRVSTWGTRPSDVSVFTVPKVPERLIRRA